MSSKISQIIKKYADLLDDNKNSSSYGCKKIKAIKSTLLSNFIDQLKTIKMANTKFFELKYESKNDSSKSPNISQSIKKELINTDQIVFMQPPHKVLNPISRKEYMFSIVKMTDGTLYLIKETAYSELNAFLTDK